MINLDENKIILINNKMKIKLLLTLVCLIPISLSAQWNKVNLKNQEVKKSKVDIQPSGLYSLNVDQIRSKLVNAPERFATESGVVILMPNAKGELERFEVWEASNFETNLQLKYPGIRSYVGKGLDNAASYLRMSISHKGISSMMLNAGESVFIEPYTENNDVYIVYNSSKHRKHNDHFECNVFENEELNFEVEDFATSEATMAGNFRTFRLALSCTGEYGQYHGGTVADVLAAFNDTMTRLNGVFEKDLAIHFNLIDDVESLIFTNPSSDPYTSGGPDQANSVISSIISPSNYDLGHLVDREAANGAAYLNGICGSSLKAGGWTAHNIPEGASFDIDYVAHEMGHQLGAGHTYTFYGSQIGRPVEVGSGNTIMAYTGITGNLDVQANSYDYYHSASIQQINTRLNQVPSCGISTPMSLNPPVVNAGADYTIPHSTPFILNGTVTGPESEQYTHNWEQIDNASSAQYGNNSKAYPTKPTGPNFKSEYPVGEPIRYFPEFPKVLGGVLSTTWESVSSISRQHNFSLTTRNNHPTQPQVARDDARVTVTADSGPFLVTAPIEAQSAASGNSLLVTWDVANTNAAPVNVGNVNIKLSTDGGNSFDTILANTPNDGSESISIPANSQSENAYILIEAVDNVFYAVSPSFVIDYTVIGEVCNTYTYSGPAINIIDGPGGSQITSPEVLVPLNVDNTGAITKFKVSLNVSHPNVGHLNIGLESPYGTRALVWNRTCTGRSGIESTFEDGLPNITCASPVAGNFSPNETLAVFKGHNAAGEWNLFASDNNPGATGSINSWAIEICNRELDDLSVSDLNGYNSISLFPNPSNGEFYIDAKNIKAGEVTTIIYNAAGQLVHKSTFNHQGGKLNQKYNVNLPSGVYVVTVKAGTSTLNQKLIVK